MEEEREEEKQGMTYDLGWRTNGDNKDRRDRKEGRKDRKEGSKRKKQRNGEK